MNKALAIRAMQELYAPLQRERRVSEERKILYVPIYSAEQFNELPKIKERDNKIYHKCEFVFRTETSRGVFTYAMYIVEKN